MDLKSGYPFWAVKNGLMHAFPQLETDLRCDVLVIGGGISGALIADELSAHGHDVALVEQRDVAWGSSAASTALLQYEIDTHMTDLAKCYGEDNAVLAYRACAEAIPLLQSIARGVRDVDFGMMKSLYYASRARDVDVLQAELALRQRHGFKAAWLETAEVWERYGVKAPGAILTELAARVDPYRMTYRLLTRLGKRGVRIFDRTRIERLQPTSSKVTLHTSDGMEISATHVVLAAGYASQKWLKESVARNRSSYAFITDPLPNSLLGAFATTMAWESARPYLYFRSTGDGRILVGGEDDAVDIPAKRDAKTESKTNKLIRKVAASVPRLTLTPAFSWAGTFAETADGLPFFGPNAQLGPRIQFAMTYGGNGITYSMIGAGLIRALIERQPHPLTKLFSFGRLGP